MDLLSPATRPVLPVRLTRDVSALAHLVAFAFAQSVSRIKAIQAGLQLASGMAPTTGPVSRNLVIDKNPAKSHRTRNVKPPPPEETGPAPGTSLNESLAGSDDQIVIVQGLVTTQSQLGLHLRRAPRRVSQ